MTHISLPRTRRADWSAVSIAADVRAGRRTATGVARAQLDRIAELDPTLGAFESVDRERVLGDAHDLDARPDVGALPLAGVPVAVKDNMAAQGYPVRHGSLATSSDPCDRDDDLVGRFRAAGAVIVGVSRMPELAVWPFTQSRLGVTRHPDDQGLDPGGSTGGGAVAVATGMAAVALGTDGGGSIRIPAAQCGLVGVKPGAGVLPLPGDLTEHWFGLTQSGYLTRTAADARLVYDALGLPGAADPAPAGRICLSTQVPVAGGRMWAAGREAVRAAEMIMRRSGADPVWADPPYPRHLIASFTRLWHAGVAEEVDRLGLRLADLEPRTASIVAKGRRVVLAGGPDRELAKAWRVNILDWMSSEGMDVLVMPATAGRPVKAASLVGAGYLRTFLTAAVRTPMTQAWNLSGLPAVVAPILTKRRRTGIQLVGKPGSELSLLQLAEAIEQGQAEDVSGPDSELERASAGWRPVVAVQRRGRS